MNRIHGAGGGPFEFGCSTLVSWTHGAGDKFDDDKKTTNHI